MTYLVLATSHAYRLERLKYVLTNVFPSDVTTFDADYVGIERLPLQLSEAVVELERREGVLHILRDTLSPQDKEALIRYRASRLTLDYDDSDDISLEALERLQSLARSIAYVKTKRGLHIIAQLQQPMTLEERLKLRRELDDDPARLGYDEELGQLGLHHLTDVLFDWKWWRDEPFLHEWKPIDHVPVYAKVRMRLPSLKLGGPDRFVAVEGRRDEAVITFHGFALSEAKAALESIIDNFWEYSVTQKEEDTLLDRFLEAASDICPAVIFNRSALTVREDDGVLYVYLQPEIAHIAGRLIGKQGANAKRMSQRLGVRFIRIIALQKPPNEADMLKGRLEALLARLVDTPVAGGG
jgi:hypothetical protein